MLDHLRRSARNILDLGLGRHDVWHDARMAFADVPVDEELARTWLPCPLRLARPARASVFIADYQQTTFGSRYREAAVLLHVRFFGVPMVFCPWMVVDDDRALVLGREMLGYPKKMAEIRFEEKDGAFTGAVSRHGEEVMRIEGEIGAIEASPAPGIGRRAVNVRSWLSFLPGHLVTFLPEETIHESRRLSARVTLRSSKDDPIGIARGEATRASLRSCDIGAPYFPPPMRIFPVSPSFALSQIELRVR